MKLNSQEQYNILHAAKLASGKGLIPLILYPVDGPELINKQNTIYLVSPDWGVIFEAVKIVDKGFHPKNYIQLNR